MGTAAWTNWHASDLGEPELEAFEDELQSDISFFGANTFGPYSLSAVYREAVEGNDVGSAVIMNGGIHANLSPELVIDNEFAPTNTDNYHGGILTDEIAALVSLELGVRLQFAGTRKRSGFHFHQLPPMYSEVPQLARPGRPNREILPRVIQRPSNLTKLHLLPSFPQVPESDQVALVRSARAYAQGIWWANQDPNQAWLQLVTALEVAAKTQQLAKQPPEEILAELDPDLWNLIEGLDLELRTPLAKQIAKRHRLTRTFLDFVVKYAPDPPEVRPAEYSQVDWAEMRSHAKKIYSHRSAMLHAGTPFPAPMLWEAPSKDENGVLEERPMGHSSGAMGAVWMAEEYPMTLSMFEHIVRGALLKWWAELV